MCWYGDMHVGLQKNPRKFPRWRDAMTDLVDSLWNLFMRKKRPVLRLRMVCILL